MESYQTILERKQEFYGKTEASYEFAAEEYALGFSKEMIKNSTLLEQRDLLLEFLNRIKDYEIITISTKIKANELINKITNK